MNKDKQNIQRVAGALYHALCKARPVLSKAVRAQGGWYCVIAGVNLQNCSIVI